ncbi:LLM class flavin-dependent oxidoreductase [Kineosporia succinea]|uniref:Alkanesulfonate monooxygenase SsuD/methylene tetrahydromethanopterin reductase-like flavin-dependent oxidoreductase (Luciferase family) n=1 Tax=Kineosporia succinea TaxID=84632 RepID=A0ABT9PEK3_9ACTN|nr:LLM class flavin-dependent oxidoreductase [Kineosporia succinea]MDP9830834.1 alkanesulfonate monooxygenase SsuD/methylene tetrahydromethanopterin reductase-like flavin-dependent oxidoreductase (luciferase family) [Kineosporia succinea]
MSGRSPVGALVHGTTPPAELAGVCAAVERAGFGELWLAEDYFMLSGPAGAAIALASTREIGVGIGIMSAVVRHPAVTAMEIATLSLAFPERLVAGIGHGVPFWTRQMGLYPASPLTSLRGVLETVRALLAGQTLTVDDGPYRFDQVTLTHPNPDGVDLYAGVVGPRSLELAGELADGTILSALAAPTYVAYARERIAAGAARSGRDVTAHRMPVFVIYSVHEDGDVARAHGRSALAFYLRAIGPSALTGVHGIHERMGEILALGDLSLIADALPDAWVDTFTVCGTPGECVTKIRSLLEAGATSVVLAPFPAAENDEILARTAAQVLPNFP